MMRAHELLALIDPESHNYRLIMSSVKFDLGNMQEAQAMTDASSQEFCSLPAPVCLFQAGDSDECFLLLAFEHPKDQNIAVWRVFNYLASRGDWVTTTVDAFIGDVRGERRCMVARRGTGAFLPAGHTLSEHEKMMVDSSLACASAIEVFSCCNVAQVEHQPPKFINAKRVAKGKVPFFSYRTLHITSDAAPKKGEATSATHASPRLHLRRGHIRRLQDERRIWVRASLVGDKSKGFAAKDYAV